jgi:hypothetical protein
VHDLWTIPWRRTSDFFPPAVPMTQAPLSSAPIGLTSAFLASPLLREICREGFPQLHQKY